MSSMSTIVSHAFALPRPIGLPSPEQLFAHGDRESFINFDHAATTPALASVRRAVERVLPYYGAVHRASGYKSELSTELYRSSRAIVGDFVGSDPVRDVVVFGRSTTELVNLLAHSLDFADDDVVIVSGLEHHSNDLPWRRVARVARVTPDAEGGLSEAAVETCFRQHAGRVKLLAVTGASNVTGYLPDLDVLARIAHRHGARIFVDAAQLVAHRRIRMRASGLDFVAFSGHKQYAPFGSGALVGPREAFERRTPYLLGGGTISIVTDDEVWWAPAPFKEEAGTPNLLGAVAMAQACRELESLTFEAIARRERRLTQFLLQGLARIPGLVLYGGADAELSRDRVGIVPFNVQGVAYGAVAEALSINYGIAVRSGCFCAQPLVARLLGLEKLAAPESAAHALALKSTDSLPGMVRLSLGLCNTEADVEAAIGAVAEIAQSPRALCVTDGDRRRRREAIADFVTSLFT